MINFITIFIGRYKKWETDQKELEIKLKEEDEIHKAIIKEIKKKVREKQEQKQDEHRHKPNGDLRMRKTAVPMAASEVSYIYEGSDIFTSSEEEEETLKDDPLFSEVMRARANLESHTKAEKVNEYVWLQVAKVVSFFSMKPIHQVSAGNLNHHLPFY